MYQEEADFTFGEALRKAGIKQFVLQEVAMPLPRPHKDEKQDAFMARCMHEAYGSDAPSDRTQEQAVAMCFSQWREAHGGSAPKKQNGCPEPGDGESHEEYIDRCSEDNDESDCEMKWRESRSASGIVHKTHAETVQGLEFVLSDESVDRMGDVITADGWDLTNFKKNPIALFNHSPDFPIGRWRDLRIEGSALRGHLELAPAGTSGRIDEIRKLIEAGILRAVSVGFRSIENKPREKGGLHYTKQELVETSLVAIPANANALAVAKSLNISPATIDLVFAGQGNKDTRVVPRRITGGQAETTRKRKDKPMDGLGQQISDLATQIVDDQDKLTALIEKMDNTDVSDAESEQISTLNANIARNQKKHAMLIESEKVLMKTLDGNGNGTSRSRALSTSVFTPPHQEHRLQTSPEINIFNKKKDLDPVEYLVRAGVITYAAKSWARHPDEVRQKIYGDDETTKIVCDLVMRAASAPAMTTVTGWAAELVQPTYTDLMPLLMPKAILTRLAAKGMSLSFGRTGKIIIPTRSRTPTIAGSFVGEGLAIPVRQGAFTTQTLTPKKLAVISTWTHEMNEHSIPAIEGLIREAIQQDTSVAVDTVLIDSNAATAIRPAGLLNGVSATTATAGGGLAALIGDIKALITALTTNTYGNIRSPVWLMNPGDVLSASLAMATNTGIFPFRDEAMRGTLNTIPIIDSATVPAKTMILVDAADFVVAGGEAPRMEISDQATLHMEDTSPAELVASPSTVAAPQRSLFQTDSLALRMVLPLNWVQRRSGTIAWTQNVTWS
jgi:HK97 family phage prohead protease/HK97 family phage major capsid protein